MKITHVAEIVKLSNEAEIVKLTHVAEILEAGSMYDHINAGLSYFERCVLACTVHMLISEFTFTLLIFTFCIFAF